MWFHRKRKERPYAERCETHGCRQRAVTLVGRPATEGGGVKKVCRDCRDALVSYGWTDEGRL